MKNNCYNKLPLSPSPANTGSSTLESVAFLKQVATSDKHDRLSYYKYKQLQIGFEETKSH